MFLFVSILMMWYVGVVNDEDTSVKGGKMSIRLEVWGENALFSRSEFKTERVTYDVMTPSAARGIRESHILASGHALADRQDSRAQSYPIRQHTPQ